jgi:hypothetical protein
MYIVIGVIVVVELFLVILNLSECVDNNLLRLVKIDEVSEQYKRATGKIVSLYYKEDRSWYFLNFKINDHLASMKHFDK